MRISSFLIALAGVSIGACALAADIDIYRGQPLDTKGITISGVATGEIEPSGDAVLVGTKSLKVVSRGPYQGALLTFANPVDVSSAVGDASSLIVFNVFVADSSASGGASNVRTMKQLRVTLTTDDDKKTELYIPYTNIRAETGWTPLGVPLTAFPGFANTSKKIKQIGVASDIPATFYLGEIRVANDTTPISVEAFANEGVKDIYIANNDVALFYASASGGSSALKYTWDFDDKDGIQEEAEGVAVEHMFRKPGEYTVTIKVSDRFGSKKEALAKINVKVAP